MSHLRFGPTPIRSSYLIDRASFVGCHQFQFLERMDVLAGTEPGAVFLLNAPFGPDEVWDHLPRKVQQQIIEKKLRFFVIDGYKVARETGMGTRINTVMQTCFFAISGVLPREEAIDAIKDMRPDYLGSPLILLPERGRLNSLWIDPSDTAHQRIVCTNLVHETFDAWETITNTRSVVIGPSRNICQGRCSSD